MQTNQSARYSCRTSAGNKTSLRPAIPASRTPNSCKSSAYSVFRQPINSHKSAWNQEPESTPLPHPAVRHSVNRIIESAYLRLLPRTA